MSAPPVLAPSLAETLWAVVVTHSEVPGDRLLFMWQRSEPTDTEVCARLLADGCARTDLTCIRVTHAFDVTRGARRPHDRRALAAFVAAGGLGD